VHLIDQSIDEIQGNYPAISRLTSRSNGHGGKRGPTARVPNLWMHCLTRVRNESVQRFHYNMIQRAPVLLRDDHGATVDVAAGSGLQILLLSLPAT